MLSIFGLPKTKVFYLYAKPISMNADTEKLKKIVAHELEQKNEGVKVCIFFSKKKDKLKVFFQDSENAQSIERDIENKDFKAPPPTDNKAFLVLDEKELQELIGLDIYTF